MLEPRSEVKHSPTHRARSNRTNVNRVVCPHDVTHVRDSPELSRNDKGNSQNTWRLISITLRARSESNYAKLREPLRRTRFIRRRSLANFPSSQSRTRRSLRCSANSDSLLHPGLSDDVAKMSTWIVKARKRMDLLVVSGALHAGVHAGTTHATVEGARVPQAVARQF